MTTLEEISTLTQPHHPDDWTEIDSAAVDTIRVLAADAVQKVGNGHPGTAMSLAPLAYTLFQRAMRHDPSDTHWLGRDRFVLSAGHSSLTLYLQLYLGGFGLELSDIESLRTWGSKTPGHPEFRHTKGVEITTGPLGQGLASAVGMAMASRYERGLFDPDAAAGHQPVRPLHLRDRLRRRYRGGRDLARRRRWPAVQQLGNLIVFYDHNQISIEDDTNIALCEDTAARYRAYGWHVQEVEGGENVVGIEEAIANAKAVTDRPSFISLRTIIGYPAPNADEHRQGARRGARRRGGRRRQEDPRLRPGQDLRGPRRGDHPHPQAGGPGQGGPRQVAARVRRLGAARTRTQGAAGPADRRRTARRLGRRHTALGAGSQGAGHPRRVRQGAERGGTETARVVGRFGRPGGQQQHHHGGRRNRLVRRRFRPRTTPRDWYGRTLHFGIREHAMGAILSGIVLHGPTRAYGGTFLQFSDYMRPAVRLASLMDIDTIYVWTHDSIGLGEDGPTHQPIEHLAALRAIPHLSVVRPADANETAYAWRTILARGNGSGPVGLILTRQGVPVLEGTNAEGVARGGYMLGDGQAARNPTWC